MSHFSDIGFKVEGPGDILCLFSEVKDVSIKQEFGKYIQYITDNGSRGYLYWYFKKSNLFHKEEFLGVMPAFKDSTSQCVRDIKLKPNKEWTLEPSLDLWITKPETGEEYPLIIDIANYLEAQNDNFTKLGSVQVTLFANSFECYKNEEEFWKQYPKKDEIHIPAPGMFIPTGTFSPNGDHNFKPHAECWCYGKVTKAEKLVNQITKNEFCHFIIETCAASYDVVTRVEDGVNLKDIAIIGGVFWPCVIL